MLSVMSAMGRCARKLAGGGGNGADRAPRCERSIRPSASARLPVRDAPAADEEQGVSRDAALAPVNSRKAVLGWLRGLGHRCDGQRHRTVMVAYMGARLRPVSIFSLVSADSRPAGTFGALQTDRADLHEPVGRAGP
jgi:hypothetical protein